ncbi:MAG TPA: response regulator [Thermoanaerobaculia bacterium]|nr:response regulator [Thermoanaerobaculia bacterium]
MSSDPLSVLMAGGPMPVEDVLRIGRDLADALSGVVHGELWPSSISVSVDGVGVLPAGSADRSRYGQYAAPERILGKEATPASDVFSIGAILFHALAGHPPFRGTTPAAIMLAACTEDPMPLPAEVPRKVEAVIRRCLMREPAQRYMNAAALRDALIAAETNKFEGKRILLADDETLIRNMYKQVAARVGVEADVVASGRDAIEAMKTRRYDVALLDLNMPRLSGWEVLDFLRSRYEARPRHLYIITGFGDQMISEADREVVNAVIYKPVEPSELRDLISESLRAEKPDVHRILQGTRHRIVTAA